MYPTLPPLRVIQPLQQCQSISCHLQVPYLCSLAMFLVPYCFPLQLDLLLLGNFICHSGETITPPPCMPNIGSHCYMETCVELGELQKIEDSPICRTMPPHQVAPHTAEPAKWTSVPCHKSPRRRLTTPKRCDSENNLFTVQVSYLLPP